MKKYPSLFFPLALIAAGMIWLLVQMNRVPAENLWALAYIWPYVLIAAGVGLILRGVAWEGFGIVVSALVVVGAVVAILYAPQLGWTKAPANFIHMSGDFMGAIEGSGKIKTETRELQSFDAVAFEYPAEVTVVQGKTASVKFEADDNLLPQLSAKISNGKLFIRSSESDWAKRVNPSQVVKITLTVKDLREIEFSAAGKVRAEKLESDSLKVTLSGAGEINLVELNVGDLECVLTGAGSLKADGSAEKVNIEIDGFGRFNGEELQSDSADVTINGAGSANLGVKTSLHAEINGAGSVGYYGSPTVKKEINGAGSVNDLDK